MPQHLQRLAPLRIGPVTPALLALLASLLPFSGVVSAQISPLNCLTNVAITPTIRSEGYTERTGDITVRCAGGPLQPVGSVLPQVKITLFYNTGITSRLLPTAASGNISE